MTWRDWLAIVEFAVICYIAYEDWRIRRYEAASLGINRRLADVHEKFFLERTKWYSQRAQRRGRSLADTRDGIAAELDVVTAIANELDSESSGTEAAGDVQLKNPVSDV